MSDHQIHVIGASVGLGSTGVSFFVSTLPILQWSAALLGVVVSIATLTHIIKNWNKPK